ncbi:MAG: hypothetical protein J6036_06325, partial [Clostridia bacterium]|nr:hypothetical protein [Clostridia bacterium]
MAQKNGGKVKKNDKKSSFAPQNARPFKKRRILTDSATGEKISAPKRPKKQKEERKAATPSELAKAIQWFPGHMT